MSSIASISTAPNGAPQASTPVAEALPRPLADAHAEDAAQQVRETQADRAATPARAPQSASELQKQIEQALSDAMAQTNLRFRVDEDVGRIVVSVVDSNTGETILQIPNEAALTVAKRLAATGSGLFDQQV